MRWPQNSKPRRKKSVTLLAWTSARHSKQQGTDLDLDALFMAIKNTYNGEPLAMTPEEAAAIRESFVAQTTGGSRG